MGMQELLSWGLEMIKSVQTIVSPALTAVMKAVTFLGTEQAYLVLLPLLYWVVDASFAFRLSMLSFVSGYFNSWTKVLFAQPRPFNLDPSVGLASEASFGLPSGHAQGTFVLAGYIGKKAKKLLPRILLLLFVMLIAFSRIYLGVHFPTDILGGWMLGAIILAAWLLGERAFGPTIARWEIGRASGRERV